MEVCGEDAPTADGLERVFINQEDLQVLEDELQAAEVPQEWITYILAYRLEGAKGGDWAR